jgi:hypothetical protein
LNVVDWLYYSQVDEGQTESRKFISDHCIRKGGDSRYALKVLSQEVVKDAGMFIQGSIDMAIEIRVLSDVEHPNIIKMRACAAMSPYEEGYFIGESWNLNCASQIYECRPSNMCTRTYPVFQYTSN